MTTQAAWPKWKQSIQILAGQEMLLGFAGLYSLDWTVYSRNLLSKDRSDLNDHSTDHLKTRGMVKASGQDSTFRVGMEVEGREWGGRGRMQARVQCTSAPSWRKPLGHFWETGQSTYACTFPSTWTPSLPETIYIWFSVWMAQLGKQLSKAIWRLNQQQCAVWTMKLQFSVPCTLKQSGAEAVWSTTRTRLIVLINFQFYNILSTGHIKKREPTVCRPD